MIPKSAVLLALILFCLALGSNTFAADPRLSDESSLLMPEPGAYSLHILTPTTLELTLITTKQPEPARPERWDFVETNSHAHLPDTKEFTVTVDGKNIPISTVGFKRRVLYAPLKKRDLRIANYLYLQLTQPISEQQIVEVKNPNEKHLKPSEQFTAKVDPLRWSPAIHVNEVGYVPAFSKKAMVGFYLGNLGELEIHPDKNLAAPVFKIIDAKSGREIYQGRLTPRLDKGFTFQTYQHVLEADFTECKTPGEYRLQVPGLGASYPFLIHEGTAARFARTFALGLYHQRCGTANELPFTRFTHGVCHTNLAEIPTLQFTNAQFLLGQSSADYSNNLRHTAPRLKDSTSSLYPFVNHGKIDVAGGHHDAGDYSKYSINSAGFIHHLVFAADVFPGAGELDNLGLPESGDGKSDLLQEAKWEADFLAKMQDADGGFYFLVYPRNRRYENNVLPDHGDFQIVWPKNTAVTAAATAALAQCASSPRFKKQFPEAAALYLEKAKKGWAFLEKAIAKYGKDGAYQKLTHYGNEFMHDDELAWAACELFLATGDQAYHKKLLESLNPSSSKTKHWGWMRLYECYGCAIRSYTFAVKSGRIKSDQLDLTFLTRCEAEITSLGEEQLRRAQDSAYGVGFPAETKRTRGAGWFFASDCEFDLAMAAQLDYPATKDPRPKFLEAILSNLNYEAGCNPVNVSYITGLGWKRQREIVHQYAQNDPRVLPPSGIPIGDIQGGFGWLDRYKRELGALSFPADGAPDSPYPLYDRWGDSFNLTTEFVILNQARSLGVAAFLMAKTAVKNQPWKSASGEIVGWSSGSLPEKKCHVSLKASGLDLDSATIVWEASEQEPAFGPSFNFMPRHSGSQWVEAEAQLPDGCYVFAATNSNPAAARSDSITPPKRNPSR